MSIAALKSSIVVVPNLSAVKLTAIVARELKLTYFAHTYKNWDYYTDHEGRSIRGRGLKFEYMIYKPDLGPKKYISCEAVRAYFRKLGFAGHVGAFTEWVRSYGLNGRYATLPENDNCFRITGSGHCAPASFFVGDSRELRLDWVGTGWLDCWSFIAFHEIPS